MQLHMFSKLFLYNIIKKYQFVLTLTSYNLKNQSDKDIVGNYLLHFI